MVPSLSDERLILYSTVLNTRHAVLVDMLNFFWKPVCNTKQAELFTQRPRWFSRHGITRWCNNDIIIAMRQVGEVETQGGIQDMSILFTEEYACNRRNSREIRVVPNSSPVSSIKHQRVAINKWHLLHLFLQKEHGLVPNGDCRST